VGKYTAADEILFTGTPGYDLVFVDGATTHTESSTYTVPAGSTVQSFTDKTGAPGMLVPATYTLSGSDGCVGVGVTLTLSGSQLGWRYQLYRGATAVGNVVNGTGNTLAFPDAPTAGNFNYTVWTVDNPAVTAQRAIQVSNVRAITVNAVPTVTTSSPTAICGVGNVSLTATADAGTTPAMTYTWKVGNSATVITATNTYSATNVAVGATTYSVTVRNSNGCSSLAATGTITVYALPTVASSAGASRCGEGTVMLMATPSTGVIDWYAAVSGGTSVTTSNSYTTPSISTSTTYYAQARNSTTNCVSAFRTAVLATVNAVPTIERIGGAASQSVNWYTPISAMTYTASSATSISQSGNLPAGVTGNTSSSTVHVIGGTPTAAGTFSYTVTASNTNGCPSASISGTITIIAGTPPYAASTSTWTFGSQTWSDVVNIIPACHKTNFTASNTVPDCCIYTSSTGKTHYLYNWPYVIANATMLCPSPWRVPMYADLHTLVNNTTHLILYNSWGYSGVRNGNTMEYTYRGWQWSTTETGSSYAWNLAWSSGEWDLHSGGWKQSGETVRCVKD
jgi:hypothetical protein